jgi:flagellar hook-basal body complex protein FliE
MGLFAPISAIAPDAVSSFAGPGVANAPTVSDNDNAKSFMKTLEDAFDSVNSLQLHSDDMSTAYANHQTSDLQSVMVASEQASISMQLATQVRNKVVEAYQNIMQMQL